jgi:hypothetical protein
LLLQTPILHIGFPKTGTTWFYDSYYHVIKNITLLKPEEFLPQITDPSFRIPEYDQKNRLVIHHPDLTGVNRFVWDGGIRREKIAHNLKKNFPDATIIIFLRNQLDFLASVYIYYVRKGGTYGASEIIDMMIHKKIEFGLDYLRYNEILELYSSLYGKDKVHIYLYEDFCDEPRLFIEKFTKRYDFTIENDQINFTPVNEKLRKGLMNCMRFTNHFTKLDNPFKSYYVNFKWVYTRINSNYRSFNKWKVFGSKAVIPELFKPEQIIYIKDYFRASNTELIQKYGLKDILKYDYPA